MYEGGVRRAHSEQVSNSDAASHPAFKSQQAGYLIQRSLRQILLFLSPVKISCLLSLLPVHSPLTPSFVYVCSLDGPLGGTETHTHTQCMCAWASMQQLFNTSHTLTHPSRAQKPGSSEHFRHNQLVCDPIQQPHLLQTTLPHQHQPPKLLPQPQDRGPTTAPVSSHSSCRNSPLFAFFFFLAKGLRALQRAFVIPPRWRQHRGAGVRGGEKVGPEEPVSLCCIIYPRAPDALVKGDILRNSTTNLLKSFTYFLSCFCHLSSIPCTFEVLT